MIESPDLAALDRDVDETLALTASVSHLGATRLLLARLNWERLFRSADPHFERGKGAPTPTVARAMLTRQAKRDAHARNRAWRANANAARARTLHRLLAPCP